MSDKYKGKTPKIPENFNNFAHKLVRNCLSHDPKDRPTIDLILDEFENTDYNLMDLKTSEIKDVKEFVKLHKENIKAYVKKKKFN